MDGGLAVCAGERGPISAHHWRGTPATEERRQTYIEETLPTDPRNWTRADVSSWLAVTGARHRIPAPLCERFPMNGKGLCLMTLDMFLYRVPLGGKLLYRDFQLRLAEAMHLSL